MNSLSRKKDLNLLLKTSSSVPNFSPSIQGGSPGGFSPVTDLAMNFNDLVTDGSRRPRVLFSETPKRRLSLMSEDGTPVPGGGGLQIRPLALSKQLSVDEGCSMDGLSPVANDSCFSDRSFGFNKTEETTLAIKSSAFRRFKSMPTPFSDLENTPPKPKFSLGGGNDENSPPASPPTSRPFPTFNKQSTKLSSKGPVSSPISFFGADLSSPDEKSCTSEQRAFLRKSISPLPDHDESSQDSGLGLEKDYKDKGLSPFAKPLGPAPRRVRILSEDTQSPLKLSGRSPSQRRSSTPDFSSLHFSPSLSHQDSPVKLLTSSLTLTPETDDGDDGFLELVDDAIDAHDDIDGDADNVPLGLRGLLSKPLLAAGVSGGLGGPEGDFTPGLTRVAALKANAENAKPKSSRGLFRSPSTPQLAQRSLSFDSRPRLPSNKRGSPCRDGDDTPVTLKRRRSVMDRGTPEKLTPKPRGLQRSQSEAQIKSALDRPSETMIGDFSKPYCLPVIPGKHQDLRGITPHTMSRLLNDEFSDVVEEFVVVDCRYPYEFEGGHIKDALNVWERDTTEKLFMKSNKHRSPLDDSHKRRIVIFHCEFSSERGPKMSRFLRKMDREGNKECYPNLYYPELYLLEGGYKAFYEQHQECCEPQTYKPMAHKNHLEDYKHFRAKSKSWAGEKAPKGGRTGLRQLKM